MLGDLDPLQFIGLIRPAISYHLDNDVGKVGIITSHVLYHLMHVVAPLGQCGMSFVDSMGRGGHEIDSPHKLIRHVASHAPSYTRA